MHIYFIGQRGMGEMRTATLAEEANKHGNIVTVATTPSYTTPLSCLAALYAKPDTIHVQGWTAATILWIFGPFLRNTTIIWTICNLPRFPRIAPYIASICDRVISSNRTVQYRLLALYLIKSEYIPDGYAEPTLPDIRPALLGLRKEQYGIVFARNTAQLKQISKIFKQFKTNKKLVLFSDQSYPGFTHVNLPVTSRSAVSLVRQAAFIIAADPAYTALNLQAMDSGRMVIATTDPLHEELFGTTATYYQEEDGDELQKLLKKAIKPHGINIQGQIRAKNHFTWNKVGQEYMRAYRHSKAVLVPFDSIFSIRGADERTRTSTGFPTWS